MWGVNMSLSKEQIYELMKNEKYPLSAKYDSDWIIENQMGSHCLWLLEALVGRMDIKPGMRILDMGCGKAISSIFLAKEFGVQVWANDLWISATENWTRICKEGVDNLVFPIQAEAHSLPYAENFFDAVVSINSFQFYGTDNYYMNKYFAKILKPGGQIGIVVPGLYKEFIGGIPDYLKSLWHPDFLSWHSPDWWKKHWNQTGVVTVQLADTFDNNEGYNMFKKFGLIINGGDKLIEADQGRNISFVRVLAQKN